MIPSVGRLSFRRSDVFAFFEGMDNARYLREHMRVEGLNLKRFVETKHPAPTSAQRLWSDHLECNRTARLLLLL
jgi:hypothetical protein